MTKLITQVATKAMDAAMFAIGLVEGAARGVVGRVRGQQEAADATVPQPREKPRPTLHQRPTPDPYDVDVETPVGTTGAGPAYNPSTTVADLQQPGTEPIMDPSTTKKAKAEADMMRKAAERNPE
jgi:hypothetical protein